MDITIALPDGEEIKTTTEELQEVANALTNNQSHE